MSLYLRATDFILFVDGNFFYMFKVANDVKANASQRQSMWPIHCVLCERRYSHKNNRVSGV